MKLENWVQDKVMQLGVFIASVVIKVDKILNVVVRTHVLNVLCIGIAIEMKIMYFQLYTLSSNFQVILEVTKKMHNVINKK